MTMNAPIRYDVALVGTGLSGSLLAIALAESGYRVLVCDRRPIQQQGVDTASVRTGDAGPDRRGIAIAPSTRSLLMRFGLWDDDALEAQPIQAIRVLTSRAVQGYSPFFLHFGAAQQPTRSTETSGGHIVPYYALATRLSERLHGLETTGKLTIRDNVSLGTPQSGRHDVELRAEGSNELIARADLCMALDGKTSAIRRRLGLHHLHLDYRQTAMNLTISHELEHEGLALEVFPPGGPFAVLPLRGKRSAIVWTESTRRAKDICELIPEAFRDLLQARVGDWLGRVEVESKVQAWLLSLRVATRILSGRVLLAGDAAHAIHPVAGQNFNLAVRDFSALLDVLDDQRRSGQDLAQPVALRHYERSRMAANFPYYVFTDGIVRFFSSQYGPVSAPLRRLIGGLGFGVVDALPAIKGHFIRAARGS